MKIHKIQIVMVMVLSVMFFSPLFASESYEEYLQAKSEDTQWFRDAKFGLFIHWGPVSLKGTEIGWSRGGERRGTGGKGEIPVEVYDNLYKEFNPVKFDAKEWVAVAKAAGMKYLVFTSKHHDGFSMFDTKLSEYKISNSPFKRNVVAELADACHEAGIHLGFYYSPVDWYHLDYRTDTHQRYIEFMHGQVRELCTQYGKLDIMWFDGLGGTSEDWNSPPMFKMIRTLQPGILINNRAGLPADYDTPEQRVGRFQNDRMWESCITICHQWAWKPGDQMKTLRECLDILVRSVGGDGNLLFNVGPMPNGEIEPRQVERLKEMGRWLQQYGESVYGTRGGPFKPDAWGASAFKENIIYLHIFEWEEGETIHFPPIDKKIISHNVLTGGQAKVEQSEQGVRVTLPASDQAEFDTIIALKLNGSASDIPPQTLKLYQSLSSNKKAECSNIYQKNDWAFGPAKAFDDDLSTRWAADSGVSAAWIAVDMEKEESFNQIVLRESFDRIQLFELHWKDGDAWKTFYEGKTIGEKLTVNFDPVTARFVRLTILKAIDGPTIREFQIFSRK
ncbi:MAG: hypothetical protein C4527_20790 [Candidatus Omnitrophota bacterium]|jgi:alpha-L-fucosidase|nr:MAG: hypothetical protein C4527_20790 [Candidatus Omnitrophota bacterium]